VTHSALLVCALFLLAGLAVLGDYGIGPDEWGQRERGRVAAATIRGEDYPDALRNRELYYGVAFALPLVWAEQLPGLGGDIRNVYLGRHLLTHLFFLAGGYFCSRMVYQLFNSRLLALFALLLFLLQPRIYAHSFFNSKDVPFLSMFMIALYLLQRAFRRDTLRAFLLCGVAVGLLMNIRVIGLLLFLAVPALRGLDLLFASGRAERRRILTSAGVFALAAPLF